MVTGGVARLGRAGNDVEQAPGSSSGDAGKPKLEWRIGGRNGPGRRRGDRSYKIGWQLREVREQMRGTACGWTDARTSLNAADPPNDRAPRPACCARRRTLASGSGGRPSSTAGSLSTASSISAHRRNEGATSALQGLPSPTTLLRSLGRGEINGEAALEMPAAGSRTDKSSRPLEMLS